MNAYVRVIYLATVVLYIAHVQVRAISDIVFTAFFLVFSILIIVLIQPSCVALSWSWLYNRGSKLKFTSRKAHKCETFDQVAFQTLDQEAMTSLLGLPFDVQNIIGPALDNLNASNTQSTDTHDSASNMKMIDEYEYSTRKKDTYVGDVVINTKDGKNVSTYTFNPDLFQVMKKEYKLIDAMLTKLRNVLPEIYNTTLGKNANAVTDKDLKGSTKKAKDTSAYLKMPAPKDAKYA